MSVITCAPSYHKIRDAISASGSVINDAMTSLFYAKYCRGSASALSPESSAFNTIGGILAVSFSEPSLIVFALASASVINNLCC